MQRSTKGLLLIGALGLASWTCAFQVNENEAVIVATLGDPSHVVDEAGLGFKLPAPIETVIRVDKRVRVLDTDSVEHELLVLLAVPNKLGCVGPIICWRAIRNQEYPWSVVADAVRSVVVFARSQQFDAMLDGLAHWGDTARFKFGRVKMGNGCEIRIYLYGTE